ncbi:MAG: hypothetical protein HY716_03560 [Planctomycetes bacterium]|nr:hypothetical protein [Planctomycetota bacterium]
MKKATFAVWWAVNAMLLAAIAAVGVHVASISEGAKLYNGLIPPQPLPPYPFKKREALGTEMLRELPNPLRLPEGEASNGPRNASARSVLAQVALLHGIDQLAGDPKSATAYLYLPSRKMQANAYCGEPILDSATGEEIAELAGWKLARLIPGGAVFRNGAVEETLRIGDSPWSSGGGIAGGPGGASADVGLAPQVIRQWAISAKASSEYGGAQNEGYKAQQACGAPNIQQAGDQPQSWATQNPDGGEEWIELTYSIAVVPVGIRIHETNAPGAVVRVEAVNLGGTYQILWSGADPMKGQQIAWFEVPFDPPQFTTRTIKITLDTKLVPGWNEIDAVELLGKTQQEAPSSDTNPGDSGPFKRKKAKTAQKR